MVNLSYDENNPLCIACKSIAKCLDKFGSTEQINSRYKQLKQEASKFKNTPIIHKDFNQEIMITTKGIKEFLNQPHEHYNYKNELILTIDTVIKSSKYRGETFFKGRKSYIFETELRGNKTWIIINYVAGRGCALHSITDSDKVLTNIK